MSATRVQPSASLDEASQRPRFSRGPVDWCIVPISSGEPAIELNRGYALLWTEDAICIQQNGRETDLQGGDLAIVDRETPLVCAGAGRWSATLLGLGDRRIGLMFDDRRRFAGASLAGSCDLAQLIKRFWLMLVDVSRLQVDGEPSGDDLVEARILNVMAELIARFAVQAIDHRLSSHEVAIIERAQILIQAHLSDPSFNVTALASLMRILPRRLSELFSRLNTTTSRAIFDARLALAQHLLHDPANDQRSIASIAQACGFTDQSYFSRCFRQELGVTPRSIRTTAHERRRHDNRALGDMIR